MADIEETPLPGVGVRYEFMTGDGQRVGVIHRRTGRRELFVCSSDDPDTAAVTVKLTDGEAHNLVDVLGGSQVIENLAHLQQHIEGLAIDWLTVEPDAAYAGKTIGDAHIRTRTGVSVVAVIRGDKHHAAPSPEFLMEARDTLVVVGTPDGIKQVGDILASG